MMNFFKATSLKFFQIGHDGQTAQDLLTHRDVPLIKRLRGGFFMLLGYALSPLCWWNDLIINLPIAYAVGYLCNLIDARYFVPGAIAGYWLSNVVGFLLMQAGFLDVTQGQTGERNFKKELLMGVVSSTFYTGVIVLLLQFKVLEMPLLSFQP